VVTGHYSLTDIGIIPHVSMPSGNSVSTSQPAAHLQTAANGTLTPPEVASSPWKNGDKSWAACMLAGWQRFGGAHILPKVGVEAVSQAQ